jgi:nitroimidazol reductase NimA-like FMN-containing flavoprotein (pyridoxamine 5'-phosphate oxidase superfamily)
MTHDDIAAHAQAIIDTNLYMTLGTVAPDGRPWTSPVSFAAAGQREFYWISTTGARHSHNLAQRPQVSFVVFDSTVPPYHGNAVYAVGEAQELSGSEIDRALEVYPGSDPRGRKRLTRADVTAPEPFRIYRATASDLWVLCPREPRQPCALHGIAQDHRARVAPPHEPDGISDAGTAP